MREREYVAELRRVLRAPSARVWALVADTNRFNRAMGLPSGEYEFETLGDAPNVLRVPVATATAMGQTVRWIELPYEWIEGHSIAGSRRFVLGPISRIRFRIETREVEGGTELRAESRVTGSTLLSRFIGLGFERGFRKSLNRLLDAIEPILAAQPERGPDDDPPAARERRALLAGPQDSLATGARTVVNEADFDFRAGRYANASVDAGVRERVLRLLREGSDDDVSEIRAFEMARAWGLDRREVLRAFLHAARTGLVELRWAINCPTCRTAAESADSLASMRGDAHCDACNIAFDVDFSEHVEAVFRISPALREIQPRLYCASSPWFRPHVFAQFVLAPGETREIHARLPTGSLLLRTIAPRRRTTIESNHTSVRIIVTDAEINAAPRAADAAADTHHVENRTEHEAVLLIERRGWNADIVLGSAIATLPDFADLFATEAPAAGVELRVGTLTMLFSDLTGSTAMYERLGDAKAFATVQEHFRLMTDAVVSHRGAIVKTMGDAVMANFTSPADAMRAAIAMIEATREAHGDLGLEVKLGLHEGPCLAVRANDRLDFFGTTVNVAARLQAQAHGSEIVVMESLLEHPDVGAIVREHGFPERRFQTQLKGIREAQSLVGFEVKRERSVGTRSESVVARKAG